MPFDTKAMEQLSSPRDSADLAESLLKGVRRVRLVLYALLVFGCATLGMLLFASFDVHLTIAGVIEVEQGEPTFVGWVPAQDVLKVTPGHSGLVHVQGVPVTDAKAIDGKVTLIGKYPEAPPYGISTVAGAMAYPVHVRLTTLPSDVPLRAGLLSSVTLPLGTQPIYQYVFKAASRSLGAGPASQQ